MTRPFLLFGALVIVAFACTLQQEVSVQGALAHLTELNKIAYAKQGNRAAGTPGYEASVDYILEVLRLVSFLDVQLQSFSFQTTELVGTPQMMEISPTQQNFVYNTDFAVFSNTPSGQIDAATQSIAVFGCTSNDYINFKPGNIAIISRGSCTFSEKHDLAVQHGASAVIIYNTEGEGPFNGRIDNPKIPSFSMARWLGKLLASQQPALRVNVQSKSETKFTTNIIAETKEGSPDTVIVVGSHLDGVPAGPGINDNGSGSASNLQLALATAKCLPGKLKNKVRFAWWGAEELGLLGSRFYVQELSPAQKKQIMLNLNFDMLASPNFFYGIYNGSSAPLPIRPLSAAIQGEFERVFKQTNTPFELTEFDGRSDYGPFIENGIPAGGLATGAEEVKTMEQRETFGGLANAWFDPCYHAYCDSIGNINNKALETNLKAAAAVLELFTTVSPPPNTFEFSNSSYLHYPQHSLAHARA